MIANYHTHTARCNHASGIEDDYVRCALEGGLEILGFSDHTPYIFPGNYYSNFRMRPEQMTDYCSSVLTLKDAYADRIKIHLGLEMEYYPAFFGEVMEFVRRFPVEYMILGQHFVGNEIGYPYSGTATSDAAVLAQYCDQSIEAMETGLFSYMAHPDLLHFTGSDDDYRAHMRRLCKAAKETDVPLEINLLGMRDHRHYPDWRFWEVAAEENCTVIFGSDAHDPEAVTDPASERQALEVVRRLGMKRIDLLPIRSIR